MHDTIQSRWHLLMAADRDIKRCILGLVIREPLLGVCKDRSCSWWPTWDIHLVTGFTRCWQPGHRVLRSTRTRPGSAG